MLIELPYGVGHCLRMEIPNAAVVASHPVARGEPLDDPAAAVAAALEDPIDFPPLHRATVPGDRVAVALEPGLPQAELIVAGIIHTLLRGNSEPQDIGVVAAPEDASEGDGAEAIESLRRRLVSALPEGVQAAVDVVLHDPANKSQLAYLAASREGKPIYVNRTLADADVVIPVGLLRLEDSLGYLGVHGGLFPTFSDEATRQRFRAPSSSNWEAHRRRRAEETDEAAWMLGCQFTVQVVPGPSGSLLHVLAGDAHAVQRQGRHLCATAWQFECPQRASLVLVSVDGSAPQQTWENFARALFAASRVVEDGGAIVVCTSLSGRPGPALRQLAAGAGSEQVLHELMREKTADALPARLLLELQERVGVYLLSDLERDEVEALGLGYVERADDIAHLQRQYDTCIVLGGAQQALIRPATEPQNA